MSDKANPKDDNLEEIFLPNPWNRGQSSYDIAQKNAKNNEKQTQIFEEQNQALKDLAESAKRQAESALKESRSAKRRSNLSIAISIAVFITTLLADADKIVHNVQKILSYLGF